jgi:SAM-dependent methyltransferase
MDGAKSDTPRLPERTVDGLHESLVSKLARIPTGSAVLDIGCGSGAWLERLADQGFTDLLGLDIDTAQFKSSRARGLQANLDFDELGLESQSFALITAIELIEHLENPGRLFLHATRLLSPGGVLLLTTPNIESTLARMRFLLTGKLKQFDDKGDQTHVYPVLSTCLERVVRRYGLAIESRWGYPEDGGSVSSRPATKMMARLLRAMLPPALEGDISCFFIRRI